MSYKFERKFARARVALDFGAIKLTSHQIEKRLGTTIAKVQRVRCNLCPIPWLDKSQKNGIERNLGKMYNEWEGLTNYRQKVVPERLVQKFAPER